MNDETNKMQRYRILAQYPDARLRVEDLVTKNQFVLSAHQIACDEDMIRHFGGQDGCTIGYITASCLETVVKFPNVKKKQKQH